MCTANVTFSKKMEELEHRVSPEGQVRIVIVKHKEEKRHTFYTLRNHNKSHGVFSSGPPYFDRCLAYLREHWAL